MGWTYCYSHFAGVDVHLFFLSWAVTLFHPPPAPPIGAESSASSHSRSASPPRCSCKGPSVACPENTQKQGALTQSQRVLLVSP